MQKDAYIVCLNAGYIKKANKFLYVVYVDVLKMIKNILGKVIHIIYFAGYDIQFIINNDGKKFFADFSD